LESVLYLLLEFVSHVIRPIELEKCKNSLSLSLEKKKGPETANSCVGSRNQQVHVVQLLVGTTTI
jgi:hypothetical protein